MRAPSPEDERAGDKHRLREEHLVLPLRAYDGSASTGLLFPAPRPPSGSEMVIHVSFLNEILTDFRSRWLCRFESEVAG